MGTFARIDGMPVPELTIFAAHECPWSQRVTLALCEVGAYANDQVKHIEMDLAKIPFWFAMKINPAGQVPVLSVGNEADHESGFINLPESGVILELVAELFPESALSPEDPFMRAKARHFAPRFVDIVVDPWNRLLKEGDLEAGAALLAGLDEIQSLLARHSGVFLLGDTLTFGDLAVAPFLGRIFVLGKAGLMAGEAYATLATDAKYSPIRAYHAALTSRTSWRDTFDEVYIVEKARAQLAA